MLRCCCFFVVRCRFLFTSNDNFEAERCVAAAACVCGFVIFAFFLRRDSFSLVFFSLVNSFRFISLPLCVHLNEVAFLTITIIIFRIYVIFLSLSHSPIHSFNAARLHVASFSFSYCCCCCCCCACNLYMLIPIICIALHLIHSSSVEELLSDPRAHTRPLNLYIHTHEE